MKIRVKNTQQSMLKLLSKWFYLLIGGLCVLAAILFVWTPLPIGLPLMMVGLPLLVRHSDRFRNWVVNAAVKYPRLQNLLTRLGIVQ